MYLLIVAINEAPMQAHSSVRSRLNLNIFDETLCDKRWSADYYRASQRVFQDVEVSQDSFTFDVIELPAPKKRTLSQVHITYLHNMQPFVHGILLCIYTCSQ